MSSDGPCGRRTRTVGCIAFLDATQFERFSVHIKQVHKITYQRPSSSMVETADAMDSRGQKGLRGAEGIWNYLRQLEKNKYGENSVWPRLRWGEHYIHVFAKCSRWSGRGWQRWCHCLLNIDSILKIYTGKPHLPMHQGRLQSV